MWSGGLGGGRLRLGGRVFKNYTVDYYGEATFFPLFTGFAAGVGFIFCILYFMVRCDVRYHYVTLPIYFPLFKTFPLLYLYFL